MKEKIIENFKLIKTNPKEVIKYIRKDPKGFVEATDQVMIMVTRKEIEIKYDEYMEIITDFVAKEMPKDVLDLLSVALNEDDEEFLKEMNLKPQPEPIKAGQVVKLKIVCNGELSNLSKELLDVDCGIIEAIAETDPLDENTWLLEVIGHNLNFKASKAHEETIHKDYTVYLFKGQAEIRL